MKTGHWLGFAFVAVVFYVLGAMYPGWYNKAAGAVRG